MSGKSSQPFVGLTVVSTYSILAAVVYACGIWAGHWAAQVVAVLGFILLPGYAIVSLAGMKFHSSILRTIVAAAAGLCVMMIIGGAASTVGPILGVEHPLSSGPQLTVYGFVLTGLCILEWRSGRQYLSVNFEGRVVYVFLATVLPGVAVIGAERLNRGNGNEVASVTIYGAWVAMAAMILLAARGGEKIHARIEALMYGSGLALAWGSSLRGEWLFGWDIQKEYVVAETTKLAGRWSAQTGGDAYNAMLSITSMPVQLGSLSGASMEYIFRLLYPMMLAAVPVGVFSMLRARYSVRNAATAVVVLLVSARAFPQQLPAVARQEVALLLFVSALVVSMVDGDIRGRRLVFLLLAGSIGFSHYTTGYTVVLMVIGSWLYTKLGTKRARNSKNFITLPIALGVVAVILSWNLGISNGRAGLEKPIQTVSEEGAQVLEGREKSVVERWIMGTEVRKGSVTEYAAEIENVRDAELRWMQPRGSLVGETVLDSKVPVSSGPLSEYSAAWRLVLTGFRQLVLLAVVLGATLAVWRRKNERVPEVVGGMIIVALAMNILLRTSSAAAAFYNPERGEVHNAIVLSFAAAWLMEAVGRKRAAAAGSKTFLRKGRTLLGAGVAVASFTAGMVLTFDTFGLTPLVFKGSPRAAVASYGEDSERFVITEGERRAALWLSANAGKGLIQSDRYGKVRLSGITGLESGVVDILHPDYIDENAWVYVTRTNLIEGRARGYLNKVFATYEAPTDVLDRELAIVYSNGESRVYK